jgi:2-oxoglutarate dehydrogenase complex dehydrogenase (E1) component-like enzyme
MESLSMHPLDYTVTETLKNKCSAVIEVKPYLEKAYMGSIGVEFAHIRDEDERLWLYENYEQTI